MSFTYINKEVPVNYECTKCGTRGCKLWRQYNTFLDRLELMCVDCALTSEKKSYAVNEDGRHNTDMGMSDQIGWLVPAVPDEESETFWGYTSVPQSGVLWWRNLPLRIAANA